MGNYESFWSKKKAGNLPKDGKAAVGGMTQFSCEKYKFFLDSPFEISDRCCRVMKKAPVHEYAKKTGRKAITGQMAAESRLRQQQWLRFGCNGFEMTIPVSSPMSFWTEQDVLQYIVEHKLQIASVYGDIVEDYGDQFDGQMDICDFGLADNVRGYKTTGCRRTGCVFCGYGAHLEESPTRFERLKITHPKLYEYLFRPWDKGGLGYKEVIDWINEHGNMNIKY